MNNKIRTVLSIAVLCFALTAQAQDVWNNPRLQERITQAKLAEIQKVLQLSEVKMKALMPIYRHYESELHELIAGRQLLISPDSLSTEEADKLAMARLDDAVKIGTIRKKYYPEFRTVLTPQQVMKLYQSEAQMRRKIIKEFRRRFGDEAM